MQKVSRVIPVLPVPLVASVFANATEPLSRLEVKARAHQLLQGLTQSGAHIHLPHEDEDDAIEVGLRILHSRHIVTEIEGQFQTNPPDQNLITYYANSIQHLISADAQQNYIS